MVPRAVQDAWEKMKHKKIISKIEYLGMIRDRCTVCKAPEGFCIHTLEKDYKEHAQEFTDVLYPTRQYAIINTEKFNLAMALMRKETEITSLHDEISRLKTELSHHKWLEEKIRK
jgi:hypothetical protein